MDNLEEFKDSKKNQEKPKTLGVLTGNSMLEEMNNESVKNPLDPNLKLEFFEVVVINQENKEKEVIRPVDLFCKIIDELDSMNPNPEIIKECIAKIQSAAEKVNPKAPRFFKIALIDFIFSNVEPKLQIAFLLKLMDYEIKNQGGILSFRDSSASLATNMLTYIFQPILSQNNLGLAFYKLCIKSKNFKAFSLINETESFLSEETTKLQKEFYLSWEKDIDKDWQALDLMIEKIEIPDLIKLIIVRLRKEEILDSKLKKCEVPDNTVLGFIAQSILMQLMFDASNKAESEMTLEVSKFLKTNLISEKFGKKFNSEVSHEFILSKENEKFEKSKPTIELIQNSAKPYENEILNVRKEEPQIQEQISNSQEINIIQPIIEQNITEKPKFKIDLSDKLKFNFSSKQKGKDKLIDLQEKGTKIKEIKLNSVELLKKALQEKQKNFLLFCYKTYFKNWLQETAEKLKQFDENIGIYLKKQETLLGFNYELIDLKQYFKEFCKNLKKEFGFKKIMRLVVKFDKLYCFEEFKNILEEIQKGVIGQTARKSNSLFSMFKKSPQIQSNESSSKSPSPQLQNPQSLSVPMQIKKESEVKESNEEKLNLNTKIRFTEPMQMGEDKGKKTSEKLILPTKNNPIFKKELLTKYNNPIFKNKPVKKESNEPPKRRLLKKSSKHSSFLLINQNLDTSESLSKQQFSPKKEKESNILVKQEQEIENLIIQDSNFSSSQSKSSTDSSGSENSEEKNLKSIEIKDDHEMHKNPVNKDETPPEDEDDKNQKLFNAIN